MQLVAVVVAQVAFVVTAVAVIFVRLIVAVQFVFVGFQLSFLIDVPPVGVLGVRV